MINKIKEHLKNIKEYKAAKRAITLMLLNQYSDLIEAEKAKNEAEIKAYASMSTFSDTFNPEDLKDMMDSVNAIARDPKLTEDYYMKLHEDVKSNIQ